MRILLLLIQAAYSENYSFEDHKNDDKVNIYYCGITSLDPDIEKCQKLTYLDASSNQLTGLPDKITSLENLKTLYLKNNQITALPKGIWNCKQLNQLDLSNNRLTTIDFTSEPNTNLIDMYLNGNQIKELPSDIKNYTTLKTLDLSHNRLEKLSSNIWECKSLKLLDLSNNKLTHIFLATKNVENLSSLYLSNNLIGVLFDGLKNYKALAVLDLSRNRLKYLQSDLSDCQNLRVLNLSNNLLTSLSLSVIAKLKNLNVLDLSNNKITLLLLVLEGCKDLTKLNLSNNLLSSKSLTVIAKLTSLTSLDLSNNKIKEIPSSIGECKELEILYLSGNQLTTLPSELGNCCKLERLHLSNNPLTKEAFKTIGKLTSLQYLHLRNCNVTSESLEALSGLKSLRRLDLGDNTNLTTLPSWIEELSEDLILDLRGCPIIDRGYSENTLGRDRIKKMFPNVLLDDPKEIPVEDVYNKLRKQPLCWNFDKVKTLKFTLPTKSYSEEEVMELWNKNVLMKEWNEIESKVEEIIVENKKTFLITFSNDRKYEEIEKILTGDNVSAICSLIAEKEEEIRMKEKWFKEDDYRNWKFKNMWKENESTFIKGAINFAISEFIHNIYNADNPIHSNPYREHKVSKENLEYARKYTGAILEAMVEKDWDTVVPLIEKIYLRFKNDEIAKMDVLRTTYQELTKEVIESHESGVHALEKFVEKIIVNKKEEMFDIVIGLSDRLQNVHDVNYRRWQLGDIVGVAGPASKKQQDIENWYMYKWPGNVLWDFYSVFTPEEVIKVVKDHINEKGPMVITALKLIRDSTKIDNEDKLKMCQYDEEAIGDISDLPEDERTNYRVGMSHEITEQFVEWYLVENDIVIRRPEPLIESKSEEPSVGAVSE